MNNNDNNLKYYLYEIHINNPQSSLNDKYYYGMHTTADINDGYMGSGKIILAYQKKYGNYGLDKTILTYYNNRADLYKGERELVMMKKETLKNKCINISEGGRGGFHHYDSNNNLTSIGSCKSEAVRKRCAIAGGQGNKRRLQTEEVRKAYVEKCKYRHEHMDAKVKTQIYTSVSNSLKQYYHNPENKTELDERRIKNKETNKQVSAEWRAEFKSLFQHNPEYYRTYGKMKEATTLFKQRNDYTDSDLKQQITELNIYCENNEPIKISDELRKKFSNHSTEYHRSKRNNKSTYTYIINNNVFGNQYDAIQYINEHISVNYGCKLSNRVMNKLELNLPCTNNCKGSVKELYKYLQKTLVITKKDGTNNDI